MLTEKDLCVLPQTLRSVVLRQLSKPMPRGRGVLSFRTRLEHLDKETVPTDQGDSFHIAFFGYYPYVTIIKRAIALRAACPNVFLTFIGCCIREDTDLLQWFDQAYEVVDYLELYNIVSKMQVHRLQVTAPPFWPSLLALAAARQTKIILDLVDTALFHSDGKDELMKEMEATLLRQSWSLVHKLPSSGLDRLQDSYNVNIPSFQLHSFPWKGAFAPILPTKDTTRPLFVYCGGVMPRNAALRIGYGHHVLDPLILATEETGVRLDCYVNQNAREMYWEEHKEYFRMADEKSHFHFKKGVPFYLLSQEICMAHFGLLYDNVNMSKMQSDAFRYNMSSKIFSYLEAGLPLVVYRDFDYICELVDEYKIGLIYDVQHPEQLGSFTAGVDYRQLQHNVAAFREQYELTISNHDLQLKAFGLPDATSLKT